MNPRLAVVLLAFGCAPPADPPAVPAAPAPVAAAVAVTPEKPAAATQPGSTQMASPPWPDTWPLPTLPAPSYSRTVERSAAGDIVVTEVVKTQDLASLLRAAQAAFAADGLSASTTCVPADAASLTGGCRLAGAQRIVQISATKQTTNEQYSNLEIHELPPGHTPPSSLPGACEPVPTPKPREILVTSTGIDQEGNVGTGQTRWEIATYQGLDLDGDGTGEWFVPRISPKDRSLCPWEVTHEVYITRGTCGHSLGTITGRLGDPRLQPFHNGVREIETTAEWAEHRDGPIPQMHTRTRRYRFNGKKLVKIGDDDQHGQCHHCGVSSCRASGT